MKTLALALPALLLAFSIPAAADTVTTEADTLVVVTPNAPVIVQQGGPQTMGPVMQAPGSVPVPAPAANGAPQNEDWNDVSHINGVPVKVGERGDYLHKFRKTNIMANPFGMFFGYYDIAASHAISQNLAASVAITGWSLGNESVRGYQVSATLPLYFRRTYSGPFLEGGLLLRTDSSHYDSNSRMSETAIAPQLMFGWHWTFDSGLNLSFAAGVAKKLNDTSEYSDNTTANGYFRVGYAF